VRFRICQPTLGFDGPLTVAMNLRGIELFTDMYEYPPYFRRLLEFIQKGVSIRTRELHRYFGRTPFEGPSGGLADDAIALLSVDSYRQHVLELHKAWYAQWSVQGPHQIHLCGDASRHFPILHKECNVFSFDTGFPIDHGAVRRAIGPDVQIFGGPEVSLLLSGSAQQVYDRTLQILQSGIMEGGRFIIREANNLPPNVPEENLQAMYKCCLEHGTYPTGENNG